jgi:hypothetical protein
MEDYNFAMFTHAMDFFQGACEFLKVDFRAFFHQLIQQFVNKGLGNTWEYVVHKIHETMTMTLCNSKQANLGATRIEEQNVKSTD